MKKLFFLLAVSVALTAHAEVFTLDLTTATDFNSSPIRYETKDIAVYNSNMQDVWDSTYATDWTGTFIMANSAKFMFEHTGSAYGEYGAWEGFTISKVASDTLNQFACAAKGGVAGVGTPFMVAYQGMKSPTMFFDGEYTPLEVQICQSAYTLTSIKNGDGFAKKFTKQDTLTLMIAGLDGEQNETNKVVYYLAVDSVFNEAWTKVDLSSIGKCMGLSFSLTSTDIGEYGMNTPGYFALDAMKIAGADEAGVADIISSDESSSDVRKLIIDGQLYILRSGVLYDVQGKVVKELQQ